jgi:hypothetical protein
MFEEVHSVLTDVPPLLPDPVEPLLLVPPPLVVVDSHCDWHSVVRQVWLFWTQVVQAALMLPVQPWSQLTLPAGQAQKQLKYALHWLSTQPTKAGQALCRHDQHVGVMVVAEHEGPL